MRYAEHGSSKPALMLKHITGLWARSEHAWRRDARSLLQAQEGLNRSQQEAIARAITRSITLWQVRCRQQAV